MAGIVPKWRVKISLYIKLKIIKTLIILDISSSNSCPRWKVKNGKDGDGSRPQGRLWFSGSNRPQELRWKFKLPPCSDVQAPSGKVGCSVLDLAIAVKVWQWRRWCRRWWKCCEEDGEMRFLMSKWKHCQRAHEMQYNSRLSVFWIPSYSVLHYTIS